MIKDTDSDLLNKPERTSLIGQIESPIPNLLYLIMSILHNGLTMLIDNVRKEQNTNR